MADKTVKIYGDARFLPRHDTLENWQTKNPILLEAEPSYVIDGEDGKKIKFGDGVTPWNDLHYLSSNINNGGDITVDQTYSPISENAQSGKAVAEAVSDKQDSLVSGTNIKTINNQSILGSGNITIEGGSDVEVDQNYNPESENAQSGKAVAEAVAIVGGHYETVVEEIWQRNKIFTPVSFDYENQVITVSDGELDEYSIGDKIYCIIVPNISGCTLNSLGGGGKFFQILTVLSATELSVSNALHADTTVANFHFETVANYFLLAKNLSAKKIRVTVNGASSVPNGCYTDDVFYGINAGEFYVSTVGYISSSLPLRSSMRLETEIISPYTIFNQFSIGYNCASANPNYHWKNNGAAWATGYMPEVLKKQYLFNGDGTKIENLWRTIGPWHCNENGQAKNDNPYGNATLHICNGTYIKIERWVE